ncbi:hypothetical protein BH20ACI4_BH20ACI4_30080 [soil metagenome]
MKLSAFLIVIFIITFASSALSQTPIWLEKMKQINIFKDNRNDVIKKLGNPVDNDVDNHVWYYDFEDGRLSIDYTTVTCKMVGTKGGQISYGLKLPVYTVVEVSFNPDEEGISPKKLGIKNFNGYRPVPEDDFPAMVTYENEETGISYTVYERKIIGITFRGTKEQIENLACKESDVKQISENENKNLKHL